MSECLFGFWQRNSESLASQEPRLALSGTKATSKGLTAGNLRPSIVSKDSVVEKVCTFSKEKKSCGAFTDNGTDTDRHHASKIVQINIELVFHEKYSYPT